MSEPTADILRRWQPAWGRCRNLPPATDTGDALVVPLGLPGREREYFALRADEEPATLDELVDTVIDGPHWLTVPTRWPETMRRLLTERGLDVFGEAEALMGIELDRQAATPVPDRYRATVDRTGPVHRCVVTESGGLAAEGMMGVIGPDAVAHGIRTEAGHRRRGLGAAVMTLLVATAQQTGAISGLLIASSAGERLYHRLGWTTHAAVLTARSRQNSLN